MDDFASILALNAESVHFLSPLDAARLRALHEMAAHHRVIESDGRIAAFLLAFREGTSYDSPNYRWFAARYSEFLYIDRVVVASAQQGCGFGAQLYEDLFAFARAARIERIVCEFDLDPPNPASEHFHRRHGFREVGRQWLPGSNKQVSLQLRE
ncbi:MAG: GNAT family N-acetyltransferase [Gammaproteobacteria bacterium]|nr:MAG: GNAT family N-acetyltransferase [Gammaproteobacteria bacterium]